MSIEVVTSGERLHEIAEPWEALWQIAPGATPFQSPHWLLPWWKAFGSDSPAVIVSGDGRTLDALAPLYVLRDEDSGESLGMFLGTGITDYLDVLLAPGTPVDPVLATLAGIDCQMWDLQQLRPQSPFLSVALPDGWSDNIEEQDRCPALTIEGAGDELENLISTHFRKKLRYSRRSLEREGPVTYEAANFESLTACMAALFELHAARWQRRGLAGVLADEVVQQFHRDVAARMLAAGALRLYVLRIAGRATAVFYGFAHQGTVYYYLSGYDPELEKLSIGTVIVAHAIEQAVRDGAHTFDFLRGAEEYKYNWGATDRTNHRRQLFRA